MTDREMLELAARAAGYVFGEYGGKPARQVTTKIGAAWIYWDPLTDDGDALRLAVKLGMHLTQYPIYDEPKHSAIAKKSNRLLDGHCVDTCVGIEVYDSDPYAATRRAIVRAAAEIGRQMEDTSNG